MARKGNPISRMKKVLVRIAIVVLFLFSVFTVCYCLSLVLGFDWSLIWVKLKSMLLLRSFRFLFSRLLGGALLMAFFFRLLITEDMPLWMFPSGAGSEPSVNHGEDPASNRNVAGPSNPGPREYNSPWESFPSVPSDLPPLPAGSVPSVPSLPSVGSDFEVEQPAPIQPQNGTNEPQAPARNNPAPCEDPLWSIFHRKIQERISTKTPEREVSDDEIDSIILLKKGIIDRMSQLDPHPFWTQQKDSLVADGILTQKAEYSMDTLNKHFFLLTSDGQGCGSDSFFFNKMKRIRENFELTGRFY